MTASRPSVIAYPLIVLCVLGLTLAPQLHVGAASSLREATPTPEESTPLPPTEEPTLAPSVTPTLPATPTLVPTEPPTATLVPTDLPTSTLEPTELATSTPTLQVFQRPLIVVDSYSVNSSEITPAKEYTLELVLANPGQGKGTNIVAAFASADFIPRQTGGVIALGDLDPGDRGRINQPLTASPDLLGKAVATLQVSVNYTDLFGSPYQETFQLTFPVTVLRGGVSAPKTPTPTPTSTPSLRPQLVISSYDVDVVPLQPGARFNLELKIHNAGNATAKRLTMIVGGGSGGGSSSPPDGGTPEASGISGGSADLSNFAPVGSSNVQSLRDLNAGSNLLASQSLIVNVTTNPGAYPLKISFTYVDEQDTTYTDDQVVTLLVYSPPVLEISFSRDPGFFSVGQSDMLPVQVVNLGRKTAILGNLKVSSDSAELQNNVVLIGSLEAGGYFPIDVIVFPAQPGLLDLMVSVSYTDDFNTPQEFVQTLSVEVVDGPLSEPGEGGMPGEGPFGPGGPGGEGPYSQNPETIWQKAWRFLRGLIGLDSRQIQQVSPDGMPPQGTDGPPFGSPSLVGP